MVGRLRPILLRSDGQDRAVHLGGPVWWCRDNVITSFRAASPPGSGVGRDRRVRSPAHPPQPQHPLARRSADRHRAVSTVGARHTDERPNESIHNPAGSVDQNPPLTVTLDRPGHEQRWNSYPQVSTSNNRRNIALTAGRSRRGRGTRRASGRV